MAQLTNITEWWNETDFSGKRFYRLEENGALILNAGTHHKERTIATLTPAGADATLKALLEKFPEVEAKFTELETEWVAAEDKTKLAGKVERMAEYLLHTSAVGDFDKLFTLVDGWQKTLDELSEENYKVKLQITEAAEGLVESANFKEATQAFKDIAEKWKNSGYADKRKSDVLWNRIEKAKQAFYDRKRTHHEDQDKERMGNLDLKMELVDKAERLAASEEWKSTSEAFKALMEQWKTLGYAGDKNESLWERFIAAKNVFFERKKAYTETVQQEQEANYLLKQALVEQAEALKDNTTWSVTAKAYEALTEQWKAIGRVPSEKGDDLWNRFNGAKDVFFQAKKHNGETFRLGLEDNYAQKMAILKRADSIKNSSQWRDTTDEMNELMDEWKAIGPVPREHSDKIWADFLAARKQFFKRKDAFRDQKKVIAEKQKTMYRQQSYNLVLKLDEEIRDDEKKIEEFKNDIENITPSKKEKELRDLLQNLVNEAEARIARNQEKLAKAKQEVEKLEGLKEEEKVEEGEKVEEPVQPEEGEAKESESNETKSGA